MRIALVPLGFLGLVALAAGAFAVWLINADLKPIFESEGSDRLQRRITVGSLKIGWGDPLAIEISDLRIANTSWGSVPEMVRVGHLSALVDVRPLFRGVLSYEKLRVEDATVVLERDGNGTGNWKFGTGGTGGGPVVVPTNRTQFPILIDAALARGLVTYRTSSGKTLRISLDHVVAHTGGEEMPITLQGQGAYNDVPGTFEAQMQSNTVLWDARKPFGAKVAFSANDTTVNFDGTMAEPLDFEGVLGRLTLEARTLNGLLKLFEADASANIPLVIAGLLKRNGDDWSLSETKGNLATSEFTGTLALHEGGRGKPDNISADADFKMLDIDGLVSDIGDGKIKQSIATLPLQLDMTGVNLAARLSSDQVRMAARRFSDVRFDGQLAGGDVTLRALRFTLAGGTFSASGTLEQGKPAGRLVLTAFLTKAEADALAQLVGAPGGEIRGRLDGGATLEMTGGTLGEALKTSRGAAVITMDDGDVARVLIEQASADLRALFRAGEGRVPVTCQLGVLTLVDGIGAIWLRLESHEATLVGAGKIDFIGHQLDLMLKSDRDTTGFFALDVPIVVRGPFKRLEVTPLLGTDEDRLDESGRNVAAEALPAALRKLARGSACAR